MTWRGARYAIALAAVLALGAGCALPQVKLPAPPAANPSARAGGILTIGVTAPAGVDPLSFQEPSSVLIGSVLCDTLVTLDPETGEVKPGLAQKWTFTDDGARIIFQLRKDAYFHDGRKVRSADVTQSLQRLANPEHASYVAELMNPVAGLARFRAEVEEGLPSPSLFGLRVIEPYSFEIFLNGKDPDFLRALAHPATAPVSKAPYDRDPESAPAHPQCAGPYRLSSPYQRGSTEIALERFDRYHARATTFTGGGRGWADALRFRVYPDENAVYQAYERGEVDLAGVPSPRTAEARQRFGDRVVVGNSPQAEFVMLPHGDQSPFIDVRTRRALSLALDRTAIAQSVYGDAHVPATGFVPPALTTEPTSRKGKAAKRVDYGCGAAVPAVANPDEARRLWAEVTSDSEVAAGREAMFHGDGERSMSLVFNDEAAHRKLAESVTAQWRDVLGITIRPLPVDWEAFRRFGERGGGELAGAPGGVAVGPLRLSYSPPYSSAQAFLGSLFFSKPPGAANWAKYDSAPFNEALQLDTRPVVNDDERRLRVRELEELLCDDMPIVPIAFARRFVVVRERVVPVRASGRVLSRDGALVLRDLAVAP